MKSPHSQRARYGRSDGQTLVLFVLFSVVLILFVGLGIDLGFAYVTKAQLSKALDASSLAAVSNYSGADSGKAAKIIAANTFLANYGSNGISGRATGGLPVNNVGTFVPQANGNLLFTNTASAQINTFFIGLLPQWKTLTVADTAVAVRAPAVLTLVVDRTGSMDPTGPAPANCRPYTQGGLYLPDAVTQFINIFDETLDRAALVSFAVSSANDVVLGPVKTKFKAPIISTLNGFTTKGLWAGGTCSIAGLTNALRIQNAAGAPVNAVKAVIFFTDGRANMTTGVFNGKPYNFGGNDPIQIGCPPFPDPGAAFYATNTAENAQGNFNSELASNICGAAPNYTRPGTTITAAVFTDSHGVQQNICASHVTEDATNRCVLIANQMRASSNYVYAVGLAANNAFAPPTLVTLQQIANDPNSPSYDSTQPTGAAFLSSGEDLSQVFQQVAADIILRLVQ